MRHLKNHVEHKLNILIICFSLKKDCLVLVRKIEDKPHIFSFKTVIELVFIRCCSPCPNECWVERGSTIRLWVPSFLDDHWPMSLDYDRHLLLVILSTLSTLLDMHRLDCLEHDLSCVQDGLLFAQNVLLDL